MPRTRLELIEQIVDCENCSLHEQCTSPVAFKGTPGPVAIIGEAPGETEDRLGKPFVGPAGDVLNDVLDRNKVGDVMMFNTVSCFPHGTPTREQVKACSQNRLDLLEFSGAQWVLLLGKVAMKAVAPWLELKHGHGRPFEIDGRVYMATYHPAAVLYDNVYRKPFNEDVATFAEMTRTGDWHSLVAGECAGCPIDACWWDDYGLGWCEIHMPAHVREKFKARMEFLDREYAAARERFREEQMAEMRRDAALEQVGGADDAWMERAFDVLSGYLRTHAEFFVDDFWAESGLERPAESRALGPVVMRAQREGMMEKSGQFRKSTASNMTEKPCWTSLVFQGVDA